MKKLILITVALLISAAAVFAHVAKASKAKVSVEQARQIALNRVNGTIQGQEIEREDGILVWSFEILNADGATMEVLVNADNGSVVSVEKEEPDDEHEGEEEDGQDEDDDENGQPKA